MKIAKRNFHETSREYVYRVITDNIISLDLMPGSLVSENEIAKLLGVSRTPVREAFIQLSKLKLMEIIPQKGSRISLIDYNLVDEANFMRCALEMAVVEAACNNYDKLNYDKINENIALQKYYFEKDNPEKLFELDDCFHKLLFELCQKNQCYYLLKEMTAHFDRVRNMSLYMVKDINIYYEHKLLLEAIKCGDREKSLKIISDHLEKFKIHGDKLVKIFPDFFKKNQLGG